MNWWDKGGLLVIDYYSASQFLAPPAITTLRKIYVENVPGGIFECLEVCSFVTALSTISLPRFPFALCSITVAYTTLG